MLASFHTDVVGSMQRPARLVEARAEMRAGRLDVDAYKAIEDAAVDEALRIQEDAGLEVVTDGEQRRDIFFGLFVAGVDGLLQGRGRTARFRGRRPEDAMEVNVPFNVVERLRARPCPALEELAYVQSRTDRLIKITVPSPMIMLGFWGDESRDAYPDPWELAHDAAAIVRDWVLELHAAGARYVQIDAPELNEAYADPTYRAGLADRGIDPQEFLSVGTELLGTIADLATPGMLKGLHVCKGNGLEAWIAEGGYEDFSQRVFARASNFDVFHLEYDDERSGGFEPLRNLPEDKLAVLGLVSTKWMRMEDPDEVRARIKEASAYHPLDRLGLAPQCGFASASETAEQRRTTAEAQSDKLKLVVDVARSVWSADRAEIT